MRVITEPDRVRVIDRQQRETTVEGVEWVNADAAPFDGVDAYTMDRRERVHGERLTTAPVTCSIVDQTGEETHVTRGEDATFDASDVLVVRTPVLVVVRAAVAGRVAVDEQTRISLDAETELSLGFISRNDTPDETIVVPDGPMGVATAVVAAAASTDATSPNRSFPNARNHPPAVRAASETRTENEPIRKPDEYDTGTDVTVAVPRGEATRWLYPLASLAYYVAADVRLEERDAAVLRADGETFQFGPTPDAADQTASDWLRRVFYFDCHARSAGPHGVELATHEAFSDVFDAETIYDAPMAERVRRYLSETTETPDAFPEWHLGVHVEPQVDRVGSVPKWLNRLADLYLPAGGHLTTAADRLEWNDEVTVRGTTGLDPVTPTVTPEDRAATVGWAAPLDAVGGFNWRDPGQAGTREPTEQLSVVVLRTSPDMTARPAVEAYRSCDRMDTEFVRQATTDRLAAELAAPNDIVHVVGHHDPNKGIECPDGFLDAYGVEKTRTQTFFLNACGSFEFGARLVDTGAAAGVVTTRPVTDEAATTVGSQWARLLAAGWSVERAIDLCRRLDQPDAYVAVGDGTHVAVDSDANVPPAVRELPDGRLSVTHNSPRSVGGRRQDVFSGVQHLQGVTRVHDPDDDSRNQFYASLESPIIRDESLTWL